LFDRARQIGFARVIPDRATVALLNDVFVLPEFRDMGLGKSLVQCVISHSELQGLRAWILVTRDAHELYGKFGFKSPARPNRYMELRNPNVDLEAQ
jgi:predicted N-acetyltransferase YhbS